MASPDVSLMTDLLGVLTNNLPPGYADHCRLLSSMYLNLAMKLKTAEQAVKGHEPLKEAYKGLVHENEELRSKISASEHSNIQLGHEVTPTEQAMEESQRGECRLTEPLTAEPATSEAINLQAQQCELVERLRAEAQHCHRQTDSLQVEYDQPTQLKGGLCETIKQACSSPQYDTGQATQLESQTWGRLREPPPKGSSEHHPREPGLSGTPQQSTSLGPSFRDRPSSPSRSFNRPYGFPPAFEPPIRFDRTPRSFQGSYMAPQSFGLPAAASGAQRSTQRPHAGPDQAAYPIIPDHLLNKMVPNIERFEPGVNGDLEISTYLKDIEYCLRKFPHATVDDRIYLIRATSSREVTSFILRQPLSVQADYNALCEALRREFEDPGDETGLAAAMAVTQGKLESPLVYYRRLRKAFFGPRNDPGMEEDVNFKTLFIKNLHPATSHPLGIGPCPRTMSSSQLRDMAVKGFAKHKHTSQQQVNARAVYQLDFESPRLELNGAPYCKPTRPSSRAKHGSQHLRPRRPPLQPTNSDLVGQREQRAPHTVRTKTRTDTDMIKVNRTDLERLLTRVLGAHPEQSKPLGQSRSRPTPVKGTRAKRRKQTHEVSSTTGQSSDSESDGEYPHAVSSNSHSLKSLTKATSRRSGPSQSAPAQPCQLFLGNLIEEKKTSKLYLPITLEQNVKLEALVDTGADITMIPPSMFEELNRADRQTNRKLKPQQCDLEIRTVSAVSTPVNLCVQLLITIGPLRLTHPVYVSPCVSVPMLMGKDLLSRFKPLIDFKHLTLWAQVRRPLPIASPAPATAQCYSLDIEVPTPKDMSKDLETHLNNAVYEKETKPSETVEVLKYTCCQTTSHLNPQDPSLEDSPFIETCCIPASGPVQNPNGVDTTNPEITGSNLSISTDSHDAQLSIPAIGPIAHSLTLDLSGGVIRTHLTPDHKRLKEENLSAISHPTVCGPHHDPMTTHPTLVEQHPSDLQPKLAVLQSPCFGSYVAVNVSENHTSPPLVTPHSQRGVIRLTCTHNAPAADCCGPDDANIATTDTDGPRAANTVVHRHLGKSRGTKSHREQETSSDDYQVGDKRRYSPDAQPDFCMTCMTAIACDQKTLMPGPSSGIALWEQLRWLTMSCQTPTQKVRVRLKPSSVFRKHFDATPLDTDSTASHSASDSDTHVLPQHEKFTISPAKLSGAPMRSEWVQEPTCTANAASVPWTNLGIPTAKATSLTAVDRTDYAHAQTVAMLMTDTPPTASYPRHSLAIGKTPPHVVSHSKLESTSTTTVATKHDHNPAINPVPNINMGTVAKDIHFGCPSKPSNCANTDGTRGRKPVISSYRHRTSTLRQRQITSTQTVSLTPMDKVLHAIATDNQGPSTPLTPEGIILDNLTITIVIPTYMISVGVAHWFHSRTKHPQDDPKKCLSTCPVFKHKNQEKTGVVKEETNDSNQLPHNNSSPDPHS